MTDDVKDAEKQDGQWWKHWPATDTTDEQIEEIAAEDGEDIARELLTWLRDQKRGGNDAISDGQRC